MARSIFDMRGLGRLMLLVLFCIVLWVVKIYNQIPDASKRESGPRNPLTLVLLPAGVTNQYDSLALKAISGTKDRRMVQINNATLMVGETADVKVQDRNIVVCCKEIRDDSVLITADDKPMELKLNKH